MATVVITFFLFVQFYVCKMDANYTENQRDQLLSRREKRWSMNSQRLEEILAELMRPIGDARRSFDTDIITLLEDYLTEAGLHALDADDAADVVAPNFAELALLLQQTVIIYGRKVDFLYKHVMDVSEALHANAPYNHEGRAAVAEEAGAADEPDAASQRAPSAGAGSPRARPARAPAPGFARTGSQRDPQRAAREPGAPRPHPTLPRVFMELEPRVINEERRALRDYEGELIGLLDDFQASFELSHSRMLIEDESPGPENDEQPSLRPISLVELQQAIEAAAPPLREPVSPLASPLGSPGSPRSPLRTSTPLPHALDTSGVSEPDASGVSEPDAAVALDSTVELVAALPVRRGRKRRRSVIALEEIVEGSMRIIINAELRRHLAEIQEFSIPTRWIKRVVKKRSSDILSERRRLRELEPDRAAAFAGWSVEEIGAAAARVKSVRGAELDSDDDDGFFEQSSVGSGGSLRADERGAELAAWQAGVLARAAAAEARGGLDVRALAARVLRALPAPPAARRADDVLRSTARSDAEVSHVLLSTLFLASAGNVRLTPGPPLSLNSFSLELLSTDERLYCAAAAADDQFQR